MTTGAELVTKVAEVSAGFAFQGGTGLRECAGTVVSCLVRNPDLIHRFMPEGIGLILDGEIGVCRGRRP